MSMSVYSKSSNSRNNTVNLLSNEVKTRGFYVLVVDLGYQAGNDEILVKG